MPEPKTADPVLASIDATTVEAEVLSRWTLEDAAHSLLLDAMNHRWTPDELERRILHEFRERLLSDPEHRSPWRTLHERNLTWLFGPEADATIGAWRWRRHAIRALADHPSIARRTQLEHLCDRDGTDDLMRRSEGFGDGVSRSIRERFELVLAASTIDTPRAARRLSDELARARYHASGSDPVERALSTLSPRRREAIGLLFGLADGRSMSFGEVAERMGVSHCTVRAHVEKATMALRQGTAAGSLKDHLRTERGAMRRRVGDDPSDWRASLVGRDRLALAVLVRDPEEWLRGPDPEA